MRERIRSALAGRYVLERELGRGASATVYSARDLKHGRRVALKVLDPTIASTIGHERFLREIRTTATLNHPHILPLFDSDETDGFIFYTMPLVEGESLRERMARTGPLPLDVVQYLATQVADALAAAHAVGVVHRDIKPENILVTAQDHVWVCDFGLARALASAVDTGMSAAALVIGSPQYMSPEQAAGRQDVDARSDVYSLGCTVFEMLAGIPPFVESDAAALLRRHLTDTPPQLRSVREDIPRSVELAVEQALAKSPSQRFPDARAFAAALAGTDARVPFPATVHAPPPERVRRRRRIATIGALTAAALIPIAWLVSRGPLERLTQPGIEPDTSVFAILPLEREEGLPHQYEEQRIRDALVRWSDVSVVDGFQVSDALARRGDAPLSLSEARDVARELEAGRIIRGSVSRLGDSLSVRVALYGTSRSTRPLAEHDIRVPKDGSDGDHAYLRLVDALLFSSSGGSFNAAQHTGTTSRPARHSFLAAERALWEWDLVTADSLLSSALSSDPAYPDALLLRAQIRFWLEGPGTRSRQAAEAAAAVADQLPPHGRRMAEGLLPLAREDFPAACDVYADMLRQNPRDFIAARGMADCHQFDRLVVPDVASPTGWSFRSSGHQALEYHIRAFHLVPASHRAFRAGRFLRLRDEIFYTALAAFRTGRNESGEVFWARPSWDDTLAFHPMPVSEIALGEDIDDSAVMAVTQLRQKLFDVTRGWVTAYPNSADALEAHAIAMELQRDPRAVETLERARTLTLDPEHRLHLSISEFWLRIKRALPDPAAVRATRALADTLMQYDGALDATSAARLAAVAAATGRAHRAAVLSRTAAQASTKPLRVAEAGAVLLAYAAVGGPADSIAHYESVVQSAIGYLLEGADARAARAELLGRAAALALPVYEMAFIGGERAGDYILDAIALQRRGQHDSVRHVLARVAEGRSHARPADIKLEGLLTEAWLLAAMNDMAAAAARLGPTLDEIAWVEPGGLESAAAAGSLARAMLLRATTANATGDRATARRWAAAFAELWRNADLELQPSVREARRMLE